MHRDEAIWYYRLGGSTLGPVSWGEIEEIVSDSLDAEDLLVARGGDAEWTAAHAVMQERPELQAPAIPEAAPEERIETPEAAPSGAAMEVVDESPMPPAYPEAEPVGPGMCPVFGLGQWISQAWTMVIGEAWPWIGAMLIWMVLGALTLGIAGPPLMLGLYMMALDRFRGRRLTPGDVLGGFSRFLPAWALTLIMAIPVLLLTGPLLAMLLIPMLVAGSADEMAEGIALGAAFGIYALFPIIWLLMIAVQTIFFYSWVLLADGGGVWDAVVLSWEKIKLNFWSYVGIYLVLMILSSIGSYVCYVGMLLTYPLLPCGQVAVYKYHFGNR